MMAYSPAEYELRIVVEEGPRGELFISSAIITVRIADALNPEAPAIDTTVAELVFTNALTYVQDAELPCDICGEYPCVCPPPPPICPGCGETPPCDICDDCERPICGCVCDTGGQETPCPECGNRPCTCPPPPPETCDVCDEYPCVCVTGPQEEGEGEVAPTAPTPPRDEGRDPAPAGPKTGDWSNPGLHMLHMLAAAVLIVAVAYRLTCSSEAVMKQRKG